jgi:hypothetical protein
MGPPPPDFEIQITAAATAHYTEAIPAPDKIALMLLVENTHATNSGTVTVTPQHSNDGGRTFIDKTALTLSTSTAAAASVTPMFGADDGTTPNMRLLRFKISVTTVTPNIRGYMSGRTY